MDILAKDKRKDNDKRQRKGKDGNDYDKNPEHN
jgi:hypothetical protein